MEQTNLPAVLDFKLLESLPTILQQNQLSASNAATKLQPRIDAFKAIDLLKAEVKTLESFDKEFNDLYVKCETTITTQENKRKPYTQLFDSVRSKFTSEEKKVAALQEQLKESRNSIQREVLRREQLRQSELEKKIAKENEVVEIRTTLTNNIHAKFATLISETIQKVNEQFYAQTDFTEYEAKLKAWNPQLTEAVYIKMQPSAPITKLHTKEEVQEICAQTANALFTELQNDYASRLTNERNRLIELIPSRIAELQRIKNDAVAAKEAQERIEKEAADRKLQLEQEAKDRQQANESLADVNKMNNAFDAHVSAEPAMQTAKGTVIKKKYNPTSHAAHLAIIQWWTKNVMPAMSLDELQTKLSFMRTEANKALNQGTKIEAVGLEVVEDINARSSKAKTNVGAIIK